MIDGRRSGIDCRILDINQFGALVGADDPNLPPFISLIDLVGALGFRAEIRWRRNHLIGLRFHRTYELTHEDAPRWLRAARDARLAQHTQERADDLFSEVPDEPVDLFKAPALPETYRAPPPPR